MSGIRRVAVWPPVGLLALSMLACDGGSVSNAPLTDGGAPAGEIGFADQALADSASTDGPATVADANTSRDGEVASDGTPPLDQGVDATPPDPGPLRIYLATSGKDSNDGLTEATSILTLERAHAILVAKKPQRDVELRIAPGTYYAQKTVWTFTMPTHEIKLMTLNGDKDRPVFDGCTKPNAAPADCPGGTWFTLKHSNGEQTNFHFWYIRVQRYGTAVSFNGNRNQESTSNGGNRIFGCYFDRIGNVFNPALNPSTAAVRLVNSDDNEIANTHFIDVVNTTSGGLIHSLYVAHMSDRNLIRANRFKNNSGDPIRLRDFSNDNQITDNKLIRTGSAGYSDWYCDHEVNTACTKVGPECPSWGNQFRDNLLDGDYGCQPLKPFVYYQDETTTGCQPPTPTAKRLSTSGNTQTATPCTN